MDGVGRGTLVPTGTSQRLPLRHQPGTGWSQFDGVALETNLLFGNRVFQNKYKAEILKQLEHQSLIEAERKRVARMRQQQLESEQFLFFEDQLKKQELARGQMRSQEGPAPLEQIDGGTVSCFSAQRDESLLGAFADLPTPSRAASCAGHSPPVTRALKPAATLSAVQSK